MTGPNTPDKDGWVTVVETGCDGCAYPRSDGGEMTSCELDNVDDDSNSPSDKNRDDSGAEASSGVYVFPIARRSTELMKTSKVIWPRDAIRRSGRMKILAQRIHTLLHHGGQTVRGR